ncbi:MAG TPA: pitrilysin family protein [Candidatus Magasanikbacteria bacterium]|nr:pitrilysin family protein [Candidatus Magasanikbacteria bacterium]
MFTVSKLKNGATLIKAPIKGTKAVTVMVAFPVGSRYENDKIAGVSHFVEHMLFKGTQKRPTHLEISRELEAQGAEFNAFTGKDSTVYYIKIDGKKINLALDLLSDMVFNSKIEKEEVQKEKGVIFEEKKMYEDNPRMHVDSLFEEVMYGKNDLGRDIVGTNKSLKDLTREDLWNYYRGSYVPENAFIGVAGNFGKDLHERMEKYFGGNVKNEVKKWFKKNNFQKVNPLKKISLSKRISIQNRKIDQTNVLLGFPGLNYYDKRRYALEILAHILGGGMSSRLFTEIREKRGLAYGIRADFDFLRDTGAVYIRTGLDTKRLEEALKTILAEIEKIKNKPVGQDELQEAKTHLIGSLALSLENSKTVALRGAGDVMLGKKIETYEIISKNIKSVTAAQIQKLAQDLFKKDRLRLAAIGPIKKEEIIKILK